MALRTLKYARQMSSINAELNPKYGELKNKLRELENKFEGLTTQFQVINSKLQSETMELKTNDRNIYLAWGVIILGGYTAGVVGWMVGRLESRVQQIHSR